MCYEWLNDIGMMVLWRNELGMMEWYLNDNIMSEWVRNDGMTSEWWVNVGMSCKWQNGGRMRKNSESKVLPYFKNIPHFTFIQSFQIILEWWNCLEWSKNEWNGLWMTSLLCHFHSLAFKNDKEWQNEEEWWYFWKSTKKCTLIYLSFCHHSVITTSFK